VNTIAESFVQDTTIPNAQFSQKLHMFVIPVFAEESAKQIEHTISHSKPMQWQNADIQIPEAKYKQEVKNSKNLINWFHH
jgi:hypothetical protein